MTIITLLNIIFLLIAPFFFVGVINKTKAFWGTRKGASIFQPFFDFYKLLKKGQVISVTTSYIFKLAPVIALGTVFFAGLLIPIIKQQSVISFDGDLILFAYLLAFAKFFSLLSALDTGSSFEGMGASREVTFSSFAEPVLFILFAIIASLSGLNSFEGFAANIWEINSMGNLILFGSVIILFVTILLEGCRIPIDDPNTHLELTMIHEVMVLDNSGVDLGIMSYIAYLKMFIFSCLITTLLIPVDLSILQFSFLFIGMICIIAIVIGTLESSIARLRMEYIPRFIFIITYIALILLAIEVLGNYTKEVF